MVSTKRKVQLLGMLCALLLLAGAVGCKGFFVNPTLSTITVGPATPTLTIGTTQQMSATATYDDGTTQSLTSGVYWATSDDTVASITTAGNVTAVGVGSATITAEAGTVSGSTTVTVTVANLQSINILPTNPTTTVGKSVTFTATGIIAGGGTVDLTNSATWTSSNTSVATMAANVATTTGTGTTTITATSGSIQGTTTLTVN